MQFNLTPPTEANLDSVVPRKEIHGDESVSAITLLFTVTGPNTLLDLLSPTLRPALYTYADGATQALDGIDPPTTKLRSRNLGTIPLRLPTIEGGTLYVEYGIGQDMELSGCKVDKWRALCSDGGTCAISFRVSTSDIGEVQAGHLFGMLGQVAMIRFESPTIGEEPELGTPAVVIDGRHGPLFDAGNDAAPLPDATDTFVAQHAQTPATPPRKARKPRASGSAARH
jgi:hypothetical protein